MNSLAKENNARKRDAMKNEDKFKEVSIKLETARK